MTTSNAPEVLRGEILAEGGREAGEIVRRAQAEAEAILAAAAVEADKIRQEKREAAQAEAARRHEMMLATIPVERGRLRSARIEAVLETVHEAARRELMNRHFDGHETVVALAAEALRGMPGTDFIVKISAGDQAAFGGQLAGEIRQRAGNLALNLAISADPTMTDGGVIVQAADDLRIWDNRLLARLDRLWPELRRQIAAGAALVETTASGGGAA